MHDSLELYELSFVAPNRKRRTPPSLVFTIQQQFLAEVQDLLTRLVGQYEMHALQYCPRHATFRIPVADLFGNITFGYGQCGFAITRGTDVQMHVELRGGDAVFASTLTIHLLSIALALPFEDQKPSNRTQQIDLSTSCRGNDSYGHAVHGYVSADLRRWLIRQASMGNGAAYAPLPPSISDAMRATWLAVAGGVKPPKNLFGGTITPDGRFLLQCPGNACDIAIYPDHVSAYDDSVTATRFSCHNLDDAHQQLTLLAGLAKMCELARKDDL